jgi:hypothetical protein
MMFFVWRRWKRAKGLFSWVMQFCIILCGLHKVSLRELWYSPPLHALLRIIRNRNVKFGFLNSSGKHFWRVLRRVLNQNRPKYVMYAFSLSLKFRTRVCSLYYRSLLHSVALSHWNMTYTIPSSSIVLENTLKEMWEQDGGRDHVTTFATQHCLLWGALNKLEGLKQQGSSQSILLCFTGPATTWDFVIVLHKLELELQTTDKALPLWRQNRDVKAESYII